MQERRYVVEYVGSNAESPSAKLVHRQSPNRSLNYLLASLGMKSYRLLDSLPLSLLTRFHRHSRGYFLRGNVLSSRKQVESDDEESQMLSTIEVANHQHHAILHNPRLSLLCIHKVFSYAYHSNCGRKVSTSSGAPHPTERTLGSTQLLDVRHTLPCQPTNRYWIVLQERMRTRVARDFQKVQMCSEY